MFGFGFAMWVAMTRITDHMHHPGDVIGGSLLGIMVSIINITVFMRLFKIRNEAKVDEYTSLLWILSCIVTTNTIVYASIDPCIEIIETRYKLYTYVKSGRNVTAFIAKIQIWPTVCHIMNTCHDEAKPSQFWLNKCKFFPCQNVCHRWQRCNSQKYGKCVSSNAWKKSKFRNFTYSKKNFLFRNYLLLKRLRL